MAVLAIVAVDDKKVIWNPYVWSIVISISKTYSIQQLEMDKGVFLKAQICQAKSFDR